MKIDKIVEKYLVESTPRGVTKDNAVEYVTNNKDKFLKDIEKFEKNANKGVLSATKDIKSSTLPADAKRYRHNDLRDYTAELKMYRDGKQQFSTGKISKEMALALTNLDNGMIPKKYYT